MHQKLQVQFGCAATWYFPADLVIFRRVLPVSVTVESLLADAVLIHVLGGSRRRGSFYLGNLAPIVAIFQVHSLTSSSVGLAACETATITEVGAASTDSKADRLFQIDVQYLHLLNYPLTCLTLRRRCALLCCSAWLV